MPSLAEQLPGPQFEALLAELRQISAKPTLEQIRDVMIRYGITSPTAKDGLPSNMAAKTLRDGPFDRYIKRLEAGREAREKLCAAAGAGKHPVDAMEEMVAIELQDHFTSGSAIDIEWVTKQLLKLRTSISMREESHRKQSETDAKLEIAEQRVKLLGEQVAKFEREKADWEKKRADTLAAVATAAKKGGITADTRKMIEAAMKGEVAA